MAETGGSRAVESSDVVVGDDIDVQGHRWSFGGGTARRFDDHVEKSVPGYRDGHSIVEQLSDFFVTRHGRVIEIGCSTGALIGRLARRHQAVGCQFVGVDVVPEMITLARERANGLDNLSIELADASRVDYRDATLVVMYYTLQFIPLWQRAALLRQMFRGLRPAGALILFEKTRLPDSSLQDMCGQIYDAYKADRGFTPEEIVGKARSLRGVLEPLTSGENAALLRQAGFLEPHVIYKYLAFEGVIAVKSVMAVDDGAGD
jgi:tRNA (cmo5U34)-methyltransferase